MTSRRLHRAPVLVLSRALVGSLLLEIVASPLACKPISTPAPARLSAHPLVSAGPPVGGEPLSTLRASTPGHWPLASAQSTSNTHFLARPQIEVGHDPAAPRVPSHGAVDHDRAAGWVTTRAPLKAVRYASAALAQGRWPCGTKRTAFHHSASRLVSRGARLRCRGSRPRRDTLRRCMTRSASRAHALGRNAAFAAASAHVSPKTDAYVAPSPLEPPRGHS